MQSKHKFLIQKMSGKTDYIMIQKPKIATSTLYYLIQTGSQIGPSIINSDF